MPSSDPRGAPFPRHGPARARRPNPAGTGPPLRAPWRGRTSVYGFGDRRAAAVPMARSLFPLFGFQPCHAGRVRGGMAWYASPDGRPTERVPPAEWLRAASLRRPTRLPSGCPWNYTEGKGLDTFILQRSSTLLASGHGCIDSAGRQCRPYCLICPLRSGPWETIFPCESD